MSVSRKDCGLENAASARDMSTGLTGVIAIGSCENRTVGNHALDAYRYIDSKDMREYLRKLDYEFSDRDMAYVIRSSWNTSLAEQHQALMTLAETTDDKELAEYLKKLVSLEEKLLGWLNDPANKDWSGIAYAVSGKFKLTDQTYATVGDCARALASEKDTAFIEVAGKVSDSVRAFAYMKPDGTVLAVGANGLQAEETVLMREIGRHSLNLKGRPFPFSEGEALRRVGGMGILARTSLHCTGCEYDKAYGMLARCEYTDAEGKPSVGHFPIIDLERFGDDG